MRYKYTDKEIKTLIKSIIVLSDTREQDDVHISKFFEKKKIKIKCQKLDFGDYSFFIPKNPELGIERDIYFDDEIVIERKGSLTELAGNLTKGRPTFESELLRGQKSKFLLMVEDGSWEKIKSGLYRSEYKSTSFLATLNSYIARYNISVNFVSKDFAGQFIYSIFYYYVREFLKNRVLEKMTEV